MTALVRWLLRWQCPDCGAINPDITGTCIRCAGTGDPEPKP